MPMFNQGRDFNFEARGDINFIDVAGNVNYHSGEETNVSQRRIEH